jgi:hypothetical protein
VYGALGRSGVVRDPSGHHWNIGHQIEQISLTTQPVRAVVPVSQT